MLSSVHIHKQFTSKICLVLYLATFSKLLSKVRGASLFHHEGTDFLLEHMIRRSISTIGCWVSSLIFSSISAKDNETRLELVRDS